MDSFGSFGAGPSALQPDEAAEPFELPGRSAGQPEMYFRFARAVIVASPGGDEIVAPVVHQDVDQHSSVDVDIRAEDDFFQLTIYCVSLITSMK